jgi:hypothetical protein
MRKITHQASRDSPHRRNSPTAIGAPVRRDFAYASRFDARNVNIASCR